ncbi:pilin [Nonomuraea antri]|uniref:pilin n=1 Tax=Nonomuraea antri TaxID=2730852 RepID=UPI001F467610|nr:pilin [Nonomuraea antri]
MTRPRRVTSPQALSLKICLIVLVVLGGLVVGTLLEYAISYATTAEVSALAVAKPGEPPSSLNAVIDNLRNVIVGLLVALATLFLTVGGVRYILAGGDPGEVEAAKKTLRYAALGYGIAVLAPVLVSVLKGIVGAE